MTHLASPVIFLILLSEYFGGVLSENLLSRLYSGTEVDSGKTHRNSSQFPYMVEIRVNGHHHCGAVLITTQVTLTAAHCFTKGKLSRYWVRAGHIFINDVTDNVQAREVVTVVKYNASNIKQDIALVKVKQPFVTNIFVNTINLPAADQWDSFSKRQVKVLGWGKTQNGAMSGVLEMIELNILPKSNCSAAIFRDASSVLCGLDTNLTAGACGGDSGGPFVLHNPSDPKSDLVIGVISFGYTMRDPARKNQTLCATKRPTVGINVSFYMKWINSTLAILK